MIELNAEIRTETGKGAARRARRAGKLPGVLYSKGQEAVIVNLEPRAFVKAVRTPLRRNAVIDLTLDNGQKHQVMVKDVQIDALRREATHVDFIAIDSNTPVAVNVPLTTTGRSKQVVLGSKLTIVMRTIRTRVLPNNIPVSIEIDVTDIPAGPTRASALTMPAGCEVIEDGHSTVITVSRPRGVVEEEEEGTAAAAS